MALLHLIPLPISKTSLLVQITGAVLLLFNLVLVAKLSERADASPAVSVLAVTLTGFYQPLVNWAFDHTPQA